MTNLKELLKEKLLNSSNRNADAFFSFNFSENDTEKLTDFYRQHPFVYAAVSLICRTVSSVPFKFFRDERFSASPKRTQISKNYYNLENKKDFNEKLADFKEELSGEWVDLFDNPNTEMVNSQFWHTVIINYLIEGSCFVILDGKNTEKDVPTALIPVGPQGWKPFVDKTGRKVIRWEWKHTVPSKEGDETVLKETTEKFKPWQVLRIYNVNPKNLLEGLKTTDPAKLSITQDHFASLYNKKFFQNGAIAGIILETEDELTEQMAEEILESFNQEHEGVDKAHKTALLHSGLKAKNFRESHRDMEYRLLRQWTRDEILAVFGVPKALVGVIDDVNRATFLGAKRGFFETTILPLMEYLSQAIYKIIAPTDKNLYGFFDLAMVEGLRGDNLEKSTVAGNYHKLGVPFNEINHRLELGFKHFPGWGEQSFLNGKPIDQVLAGDSVSEEDTETSPEIVPESFVSFEKAIQRQLFGFPEESKEIIVEQLTVISNRLSNRLGLNVNDTVLSSCVYFLEKNYVMLMGFVALEAEEVLKRGWLKEYKREVPSLAKQVVLEAWKLSQR